MTCRMHTMNGPKARMKCKSDTNLADRTGNRFNNFNFIRLVAAFAVLVTHSFALATGRREAEPLWTSYGMTFGSIAVDVFFVTSGFLVCGSLCTRQSVPEFAAARALRILPGMLGMLAVTVLVVGPAVTTVPYWTFASANETWKYVALNSSMFLGAAYTLPGVFTSNPYPHAVNGSLWTMCHEVRMYASLGAIWLVAGWLPGRRTERFAFIIMLVVTAGATATIYAKLVGSESAWPRLTYSFFMGALFFVLRNRIRLDGRIFAWMVAAMIAASAQRDAFYAIYYVCFPYVVLYVAYVKVRPLLAFNRIGDYSYGIYIYAFLVQQVLMHYNPTLSPLSLIGGSAALTLGCAVISWHAIEKKGLAYKVTINQRIRLAGIKADPPRPMA